MPGNDKIRKEDAPSGSLFLVCGTDEFEVSRRARILADQLCPENERALGLERVDGACETIEEAVGAVRRCIDALRTVGFFGSAKLVWLRDATFFYEGKPGKFEDVKKAVASLTDEIKAGLLPGVRFLVSATTVDRRTAFFKTMEKGGQVELLNLPEKSYKMDEHAASVLGDMLKDAGLRARADVVHLVIERAGNHSRQLFQEAQKLSLYLGERKEVTVEDVLAIVSPARERSYTELSDSLGRRDLSAALRMARQLLQQKESPVGLIIGLQNRVRELLVYRTALARRWARMGGSGDWPTIEWIDHPEARTFFSSLGNDPRKVNPYWGGILGRQAMNFSLPELQGIQRTLVEEHGRMTDGTAPADILLEWALIKILGVNTGANN